MQNHLPGAKVVKAFNTLFTKTLAEDPNVGKGNRVLFISGDNKEANAIGSDIISRMCFAPIDLGPLAAGGKLQQFNWPLNSQNFVKF